MKIILDFITNSSEADYYYYGNSRRYDYDYDDDDEGKSSTYRNHCWNCKNPINGSQNEKCSTCKWYICPVCGACRCNY